MLRIYIDNKSFHMITSHRPSKPSIKHSTRAYHRLTSIIADPQKIRLLSDHLNDLTTFSVASSKISAIRPVSHHPRESPAQAGKR